MAYKDTSYALSFPVPWGTIAAKSWGRGEKKFLGLHGWLDNVETFSSLAPLLEKEVTLVAFDFPGHGMSSRRPAGTAYTFLDWVLDVRKVVVQLGWVKFSMIGHSMGASVAALYAGTFPSEVIDLILIEYRGPSVAGENLAREVLRECADDLSRIHYKQKLQPRQQVAKFHQLVQRLMNKNPDITKESAERLMSRSGIPEQDGYRLDIDQRLKPAKNRDVRGNFMILSQEMINSILTGICCSVLVVRGNDCHPMFRIQDDYIRARLDVIKQHASEYFHHEVPGNHFVHLNEPEVVARVIREYLDRRASRSISCKL
ncbi:serine hydrolase-like protein 2 [Nematostella vectensis]|uniref:serine hydrolase-like protein 2 n=1 Tax=Nematostella vectensis TaxID=45351 RepID=UPI0020778C5D|nr:serine hydrolase-like protein 2 [Nematostella vectensis]